MACTPTFHRFTLGNDDPGLPLWATAESLASTTRPLFALIRGHLGTAGCLSESIAAILRLLPCRRQIKAVSSKGDATFRIVPNQPPDNGIELLAHSAEHAGLRIAKCALPLSLSAEPYANLAEVLGRVILGTNEFSKPLNVILHSATGVPSRFPGVPHSLHGGSAIG
jgi:hypothetical protein